MTGSATPAVSRSKAELLRLIQAQRDDYQRTLPEKMARIETLWHEARQAGPVSAPFAAAERLAHNLHGTAGTYGFRDLSHASHALELALRSLMDAGAQLDPHEEQRITEAIAAVRLSLPTDPPGGGGAP